MIYLQLFFSFFQIGLFSFGGGYAALPLIQSEIVARQGWLQMAEFTDLITISQMTPGPIAINAATFVGTKVAGFPGAVSASIGCILPSCVIVTLLAHLYLKYRKMSALQDILSLLRPAVVAMIASAGISIIVSAFWTGGEILLSTLQISAVCIFIACLLLLIKWKKDPVIVMIGAGVLNVVIALATGRV